MACYVVAPELSFQILKPSLSVWLTDVWLHCNTLHYRDSDLVWSQYVKPAGSGSWNTRPVEKVTQYQLFPKASREPDTLAFLHFSSCQFQKRQTSRAEIDGFVWLFKSAEIDRGWNWWKEPIHQFQQQEGLEGRDWPSLYLSCPVRKFSFSFTLTKFRVYSQKLFWPIL